MKKQLACCFLFFLLFNNFAENFTPCSYFKFQTPLGVTIKELSIDLTREENQYAVSKWYVFHYSGKDLALQVVLLLRLNEMVIVDKLVRTGMVKIQYVGGITGLNDQLLQIFPGQKMKLKNGLEIMKYIYPVGNDWSTDLLGYSIPLNSYYIKANIVFNNIVSTYVKEGSFITPWTQKTVNSYPDQKNPGIQLYKIIDAMIMSMNMEAGTLQLGGVINTDGVRMRKTSDLSSEIVTQLGKDALLTIIDCSGDKTKINDDEFPWVYVKTVDGKTGWVYGKYLKVVLP